MTPRLVAVSQRVDVHPDRDERRDALDQALSRWLAEAGFLAVPVPNCLGGDEAVAAWMHAVTPTAVVLSGGNDVGGEPDRDATEVALLEEARRRGMPLLGLCRGMQMLVLWCGGRLHPITGHVRVRHALAAADGVVLPAEVNSFHGYAVADVPPDLTVLARSAADGSIEAVRHVSLPFEGWMWHPEREKVFDIRDAERLRALFSSRP